MCHISRKKTTENILRIMKCLHDTVLLFREEEKIQLEQIKEDIKENDNEKAISWINNNAKEFREYLRKIERIVKKYKSCPEKTHELFVEIDELKREYE